MTQQDMKWQGSQWSQTKTATKTVWETDDKRLKDIEEMVQQKTKNMSIVPVNLDESEAKEIEETFENVKDFRDLGERITAPIDNIMEKTATIIENDPIMDVSWELKWINWQVQSVYKSIMDNDWAVMKFMKKVPWIWVIAHKLDEKWDEANFDMKSTTWKIENIFSGFDISYESLNKSIDMQKEFVEWLDDNLWKVVAYRDYVAVKSKEFKWKLDTVTDENEKSKYKMFINNVDFFLWNLNVLIWNLELARKRLIMRLDSAFKLSLAMNWSRPIFKTLLSVALIETWWQKAIDASMQAIDTIWNTIDNMSSDLTDKAIESNRKAEEITSKPILKTKTFIENVEKLKNHFDSMDEYRDQVRIEAEEERKAFALATEDLKKIKDVKSQDYDELKNEISDPWQLPGEEETTGKVDDTI